MMKKTMLPILTVAVSALIFCSCATRSIPPTIKYEQATAVLSFSERSSSTGDNPLPEFVSVGTNPQSQNTAGAISVETIDTITWNLIQANSGWWDPIAPFLPYMSSNNVDHIVQYVTPIFYVAPDVSAYKGNGSHSAATLTPDILDGITLELMQYTGNLSIVEVWFPYMTADGVKNVANLYLSKGNSRDSVASAEPYISGELNGMSPNVDYGDGFNYHRLNNIESMTQAEVDAMALEYIEQEKAFAHVYNMRPYMSTPGIDAAVLAYLNQGGNPQDIATMLQFTSAEVTGQIVLKYFMD